jgi:hypothetical protein
MNNGNYYGTILGAVNGHSNKGTPQLVIKFSITHQADATKPEGSVAITPVDATTYVYLSDEAWPGSEQKLEALGFNFDWMHPAFTEAGAWLVMRNEEFPKGSGKWKEKWELPGSGGSTGDPLTVDEIRTFTARRQKKTPAPRSMPTPAKPAAQQAAAPAPAAEPPKVFDAPPPPTGEDIPF